MGRTKKNGAMTAMAISNAPAAVGGAVLSLLGRGAMWVLARVLKAPVTSAVLVAMTLGMATAATNALYMQAGNHPAPLFADQPMTTASVSRQPAPEPAPVKPERVERTPVTTAPAEAEPAPVEPVQQQASTEPAPAPAAENGTDDEGTVSNSEVMALQKKLGELGFYDGDADGFYGPQTANAIRAFERSRGLEEVGAVTPEIVRKVTQAEQGGGQAAVSPAAPDPAASAEPAAQTASAEQVTAGGAQDESARMARAAAEGNADPLSSIVQQASGNATRDMQTASDSSRPAGDKQVVEKIQRGLASLGFLRGKIDGVAGKDTARAIRNFEVYYNYEVTGAATPELVDMLAEAGADI